MKKNSTIRLLLFLGVMWCGFKVWETGGEDRYIFDFNRGVSKQQPAETKDSENIVQKKNVSKAAAHKKKDTEDISRKKEDAEEKIIWGEKGGSDFITELKSDDPMEGMITDEDRDWIDVGGMKNILFGNASLIRDSNRYWIGKKVLTSADEYKAFCKKVQKEREAYEQNCEEWTAEHGYITSVDERTGTSYLPYTVNPFATEEKDGGYITPEVIFGEKAMVIYTRPDGSGWDLKKGQTLAFEAEQYKLDKEKVPKKGQKILYGYICDGKLYKDTEDSSRLHRYELTADKDGEYFITIMGEQSMVTLKNGCIETTSF